MAAVQGSDSASQPKGWRRFVPHIRKKGPAVSALAKEVLGNARTARPFGKERSWRCLISHIRKKGDNEKIEERTEEIKEQGSDDGEGSARATVEEAVEAVPRASHGSVDGLLMTKSIIPPAVIAAFEAEAPRCVERRHSIVGDAVQPRAAFPAPAQRRRSIDGHFEPAAHDLLMDALKREDWGGVEDILKRKDLRAQRTLPAALSYALKQFEASIQAHLDACLRSNRGKDIPQKVAQTQRWAQWLSIFHQAALRSGVDLCGWRALELVKREGNNETPLHALMVDLINEPSFTSMQAFLSPQTEANVAEQKRAFERAYEGVVGKLEALEREFERMPSNQLSLLWVKGDIETFRSRDWAEIEILLRSRGPSLSIATEEERNYERLKALVLNSPEAVALRALMQQRYRSEDDLREIFYALCRMDVSSEKRKAMLAGVLSLEKNSEGCMMRALVIADENEKWEWIRDIFATGKIPFWQSISLRVKFFFHDIWQWIGVLFQ